MATITEPPAPSFAERRLGGYEKFGLGLLALVLLAFGALVLVRSALQQARKTDFGVYCRAAHAIRVGTDIYGLNTCDDNGWHYCYPPPFAVFMLPFADPFQFQDHAGYLPYWVSVAVWYLLSVALIGWSAHRFAAAALPDAQRYSRRWWYARTVPCYLCVGGLGYTLARGQVNVLLVALIAGMYAAAMRGQAVRAGVWLAGAIALKVIPAYLLLYPFLRKDWRGFVGVALGLTALLLALPAVVWGPQGMIDNNLTFIDAVLAPGALGVGDQTRAKELTDTISTDSQSFQAAVHNLRHPTFSTRPPNADPVSKLAHLGLSAMLTLAAVAVAALRGIRTDPAEQLIFLGCLTIAMLHITPVSHVHYYALGLPLVAGLWLQGLRDRPGKVSCAPGRLALLVAWGAVTAGMLFDPPACVMMRELGAGPLASLVLWAYGLRHAAR